ncbi:hypothetical protein ACFB49_26920 [Sphingomonas sp. DBB INV C78]
MEKLNIGADQPAAYAVQTTYSVDDAAAIISSLSARFSDLAAPPASDICYATTNRQAAIRTIAARADAVIVVGERFSSNANRLAEVAATHCGSVQLVAQASELEWSRLPVNGTIGVTAAASAPEESVTEILASLADRRRLRIREVSVTDESISFRRVNIG